MPFEFEVYHQTEAFDGEGDFVPADLWFVRLPHQCSSWNIAGEKYGDGVPHKEAVEALETFIAEAKAALGRLRNKEADDSGGVYG